MAPLEMALDNSSHLNLFTSEPAKCKPKTRKLDRYWIKRIYPNRGTPNAIHVTLENAPQDICIEKPIPQDQFL